jgi:hypothetical protein
MIDNIMYTFDKNFDRINNLLTLYEGTSKGKGRKATHNLDLLRATTVFVHSTLEDYLRNVMIWKLPSASKERINHIPLVGTSEIGRKTKFELGELVTHRNKLVAEVIDLSIKEYLGTVSFNDTSDIATSLSNISIETTENIKKLFPILNEMIKRRHKIVHNADRDSSSGSGNHRIKSISLKQVESWRTAVDKFVREVNKNLN